MNAFTAYLVAEHLQDLLREAEADRLRAIVRAGNRTVAPNASTALGIIRRVTTLARRLRDILTGPSHRRPAEA